MPDLGIEGVSVSRETFERLKSLEELVKRWSGRINLVSKASLDDIWSRHILDSVQIWPILGAFDKVADIGSGGGFPGLVLAIMAAEQIPDARLTLVESDQRKCVFLRTVIRELSLNCAVETARIEALAPQGADVMTARALAPLENLLAFSERHLLSDGRAVFPKGQNWKNELESALKTWSFRWDAVSSQTDPHAVILQIDQIERK